MKRFPKALYFVAFFAALALSCGEKPQPEPEPQPLKVTPASVQVVALGETRTFSILSSKDWYVRSSASWIKLPTASGKASETAVPFIVNILENKDEAERSGTFTVANLDGESVEVSVRQAGASDTPLTYGIASAEDLVGFAKAVNGEGSIGPYLVNGVATLLCDIDASSITEWVPIGSELSPLNVNFDGGGHTIKNVHWTVDVTKYPHSGLMGYAKDVTVEKLTFGDEGSRVRFIGNSTGKVRAAGVLGYALGVTMECVTNNADLIVEGTSATGNNLIIGGIAGYADKNSVLGGETRSKGCVNNGDVFVKVPAQQGGILGYLSGKVTNCTNNGTILGKVEGDYGPGWACSYNKNKENFTSNYGYGRTGDYDTYINNPAAAPADALLNAMRTYTEGYDIENNTVDWTKDSYYDWTELERRQLNAGAVYYHLSCTNVPRHLYIVEVDLTNPAVEITNAIADDIVPNPNGNGNNNNGFNLRETLSQLCARKRAAGQKILAGVNCSFFDSNDGFPRGFHVEEGHPVFINNPQVAKNLVNHVWSFTVFKDRTASCGVKKFNGKIRMSGEEYAWGSLNDTILRHCSPAIATVNLYNSRYVQTPHPQKPAITNSLASDALYVICEWTGEEMSVNEGYAAAKVVEVRNLSPVFITDPKRFGIAVCGEERTAFAALKAGDPLEVRCDISIDGDASKPIYSLDSTMYMLMDDGKDASNTPGSSASLYTKYDPKTFPVISRDRKKVWLVEVDGRQLWYSLGVKGYEIYRIAEKLGGWWTTGMDGGGSSAIWIWDSAKGAGSLVNKPCDSKGERSDMTYVLVREK